MGNTKIWNGLMELQFETDWEGRSAVIVPIDSEFGKSLLGADHASLRYLLLTHVDAEVSSRNRAFMLDEYQVVKCESCECGKWIETRWNELTYRPGYRAGGLGSNYFGYSYGNLP